MMNYWKPYQKIIEKKGKKSSCKVVRLSIIILLYSIFFLQECACFPRIILLKRRVTQEPRSNQLPNLHLNFAEINRVIGKVSRLVRGARTVSFGIIGHQTQKWEWKFYKNEIMGGSHTSFFSSKQFWW
jgi:hypothetical protein